MKTLPLLIALLALGASPLVAAQSAPVPSDDVGHTGTDTAQSGTIPSDDVGHTGTDTAVSEPIATDDVGHTGTDTAVSGTIPTDDVGHTGTDTVMATAPATPALSLQPGSSSMVGPGSMKVTAVMLPDPNATTASTKTFTVPLSSSDPACTVPASVDLVWSSTVGGTAAFAADCSKVSANKTITISSGGTSASFTLTRK